VGDADWVEDFDFLSIGQTPPSQSFVFFGALCLLLEQLLFLHDFLAIK
jgi:hypothetical protein